MSTQVILNDLKEIFYESVTAVKPETVFHRGKCLELTQENQLLKIRTSTVVQDFNVTDKKIHLIGFGKAVYGMAIQVEKILQNRLVSGIISVPCNTVASNATTLKPNSVIEVLEGAKNNLPDEPALVTTKKIVEKCQKLTSDDVLIVLVSGGGSSLLTYPKPPLTLEEKFQLIRSLAHKGATINELNTVRTELSNVKGGKLALAAKNAHLIITLIVSDIINDPIELIASGPTVLPKHSSTNQVIKLLEQFQLLTTRIRETIMGSSLTDIEIETNLIKDQNLPNVHNFIILNNEVAINKAIEVAKQLNYESMFLSKSVDGLVSEVVDAYIDLTKFLNETAKSDEPGVENDEILKSSGSKKIASGGLFLTRIQNALNQAKGSGKRGLCLISGGETTVNVTGTGRGGRNQELALRFALKCIENNLNNVYFLSAGTDGIDGPTSAAGAIGYKLENIEPNKIKDFLQDSDSFRFFESEASDCHIITGHTGTNVMDIHILLMKF